MKMNIWALDKDESIKVLLLLLCELLPQESYLVDESQELNSKSVRLLKADEQSISAYLYTYGQEANTYGVHLELPENAERSRTSELEVYESLGIDHLVEILCVHFDVIQGGYKERGRC